MSEIAFVNGTFMPLGQAVVPVEDRGFQFADGVYEVVATYRGRPYALEPHLRRLERSLRELRIVLDIRAYGLAGVIEEGIRRSGFAEALVYVQITRGVAPRHHEFPAAGVKPTVVLTVKELRRPAPELYEHGVRVIAVRDLRWKRCDIKSIALLANILAKQEAAEAGAFEALLVDDQGQVTEGSSTSAFRVTGGGLWTAPEGPHILPSITRGILLDLARRIDLPVREEDSTLEEYLRSDEVFLAGTTTEAMAVVRIGDQVIGDGRPGPVTRRLRAVFLADEGRG
ncbi:MAG: aminotransferase class IV [Candidatus Latescibacterota bacterium]|jgi:D-alanine transaminase